MDKSLLKLDTSINVDNKILSRKHIAERQRRARINFYLEEIQKITSHAYNKTDTVKPEKAEVLETAVNFLEEVGASKNSGSISDTDCYKQGFQFCMTTLLDKTVDSELTGLRNHLEDFLQNLTTEAETMTSRIERSPAMPASYIQSPGAEWYQSQNGYDVVKTINQSNRTMQRATNGIDYSLQSQSLLCSVQNSPVWYTDWNTQMQMQYIQANRDPHSGEYSTYDALQGIQNVYSNYLQDGAEVSPSATQSSSKMRSTNIQDNCNNAIQSYKCANTSITCTSDNGIKPRSGSPAINSQTESDINEDSKIGVVRVQQQMDSRENDCGSGQIWRPW